jgi:alpha-methylacyl-CoA racemase
MNGLENPALLRGTKIVSLALNAPGPAAAARLTQLGAEVIKIEPPEGDATSKFAPEWYAELCAGQQVLKLDLKDAAGKEQFDGLLAGADLLLASFRPSALRRLGMEWETLHQQFPRLCFVGIIGHPAPDEERSGHDLTYQADFGLLRPPQMPATLFIDMAGAERAVSTALALLYRRSLTGEPGRAWVSLYECAHDLAAPLRVGLTTIGGLLGGGYPFYGFYAARDGWIAIAALEPRFAQRLLAELKLEKPDRAELERIFLARTAAEWERWAAERDLPLVAVRQTG